MDPEMSADAARLSAIERELQNAKDREQQTQNTLSAILAKIESLSTPVTSDSLTPPTNTPPIPPKTRPQLKASPPKEFSGDRTAGLAFLNSCKLYLSLCSDQFVDDQARIHWALSFMKEGCAAQFSDRILRTEAYNQFPMYETWSAFEREFTSLFLPPHRDVDAANRLESTAFYQGKRTVEEYLDEFRYLIDEAGYQEGLGIVMKFRRGLNPSLQNQIAILGQGRPSDSNPEAWYTAARLYEQSRASNAAFTSSRSDATPNRSIIPIRPNTIPNLRNTPVAPTSVFSRPIYGAGVPAVASNRPAPMDIDATRKRNITNPLCHRCGKPGHFIRDCPQTFDVRYMTEDEREEWVQHLLVAKDVAEVADKVEEVEEIDSEDFGTRNE